MSTLLEFSIWWSYVLLLSGVFLCFGRLAKGPTLPDRVIALDLMGVLSVAFAAVFTISSGQRVYLDPATVLALVAFLGTVTFARRLNQMCLEERKGEGPSYE